MKKKLIRNLIFALPIFILIWFLVINFYFNQINVKTTIITVMDSEPLLIFTSQEMVSRKTNDNNTSEKISQKALPVSKNRIKNVGFIKDHANEFSQSQKFNLIENKLKASENANINENSLNIKDNEPEQHTLLQSNEIMTVSENDAGLRLNNALKILNSGDTLLALEQMRGIAKDNRRYLAVWHHLTLVYLQQNDKVNAVKCLNKLLKLVNSDRIKKTIKEVLHQSEKDRFDDALKKFKDLKPDGS
jgi:tetratricopeptide (TPR) repeat protein